MALIRKSPSHHKAGRIANVIRNLREVNLIPLPQACAVCQRVSVSERENKLSPTNWQVNRLSINDHRRLALNHTPQAIVNLGDVDDQLGFRDRLAHGHVKLDDDRIRSASNNL
jgi:hypothetical protein